MQPVWRVAGDELVIGDGNFPAQSMSRVLVRCDGNTVPEILGAILPLFPLDRYVDQPAALMDVGDRDRGRVTPTRWNEYMTLIHQHEEQVTEFHMMERFAFYERAQRAYAIVSSGDMEIYANIILKKGVVGGVNAV